MEKYAFFPGTPTWTAKDIPDQTGKVAIVTGGNTGIGKETCLALVKKGAKVYLAARSEERANEAIKDIKEKTGSDNIVWLKLDLADLASVKNAAEEFQKKEKELHTLYCNAGVMMNPAIFTKDGYDIQWGSNVVGHYVFSLLLLPVLKATASHNPKGTVRIVNVSSVGHTLATRGIVWNNLNLHDSNPTERYAQSKLGNVLQAKEFAKRFAKDGIYSMSVHPGNVKTELDRGMSSHGWFAAFLVSWIWRPVGSLFLLTPEQGAITQLYVGTSPEIVEKDLNGSYFIPYCRPYEPSSFGRDPKEAEKLWEYIQNEMTVKNIK